MKKLAVLIGFATMLTGCVLQNNNDKKEAEAKEMKEGDKDFVALFDGKTLNGWHGYGKGNIDGRWKIYDSTYHRTRYYRSQSSFATYGLECWRYCLWFGIRVSNAF